jgi:prepilin-type processing-associated H-X9-DG protein
LTYPNWDGHNNRGWLYLEQAGHPPPVVNTLVYAQGELWTYLGKNVNVYWCPVDASKTNTPASSYPARLDKLSTYLMNGAASDFNAYLNPPFKLSAIKIDGCLMWEPPDTAGSYNDGAEQPMNAQGPSLLHNGGCVLLYLDGHTSFMISPTFVYLNNSALAPNEFWWVPTPNKAGVYDGGVALGN